MLCIINNNTDPYFNLAAEEYFFHHSAEEIFMLWQNQPSIIVGKHQNTLAEINYQYIKRNNIPVVRRLSGGGTVYHDLGNLNFTFIQNGQKGNLINFKKFTQPILDVLHKLNIDVIHGDKNDLLIGEKKISGNAEHIFKERILHHGTLLFSSDLSSLNEAIRVSSDKYQDKAVKSRRSVVTNISDHLKQPLTLDEFSGMIRDHIISSTNAKLYQINVQDIQSIEELSTTKYQSWDWNYGYSPRYMINRSDNEFDVHLTVEKGLITEALIKRNGKEDAMAQIILGKSHVEKTIRAILSQSSINSNDIDKIIYCLF